ncbi:MAG: helix-turn-helix transcriptional regulator [Leptolyngbyaceae cyanobacterium CRU_2_3]|nr:helix-turn-helix transcriptional regulator [Leptolyngbyaceae cyanobacterium CRU_2_3]
MGLVRLRIKELAEAKGWTLKEVANRSGVNYRTIHSYVRRDGMAMIDYTAVQKIARAFEVAIEDLVEVLEE